jgi:hypothetical protein
LSPDQLLKLMIVYDGLNDVAGDMLERFAH